VLRLLPGRQRHSPGYGVTGRDNPQGTPRPASPGDLRASPDYTGPDGFARGFGQALPETQAQAER